MGKRQLVYCDLCKVETDDLHLLSLKKSGKKNTNKFEVCEDCTDKLQKQLVAGENAQEWSFATVRVVAETKPEIIYTDTEDDENNMRRLKDQERLETLSSMDIDPVEMETPPDSGDCVHMNKGRVNLTMRNGKKFAYRICKQCRQQIPEHNLGSKDKYRNQKLEKDINLRSF